VLHHTTPYFSHIKAIRQTYRGNGASMELVEGLRAALAVLGSQARLA